MTQSADLLRLLEPTVRPVATPNSAVKPTSAAGDLPFEQQDFATLLGSARQPPEVDEPLRSDATEAPAKTPLDSLADFGRIENAGLRELLASRAAEMKTAAQAAPDLAA